MVEVNNQEPTLAPKRKPDICSEDPIDYPNKAPKIESLFKENENAQSFDLKPSLTEAKNSEIEDAESLRADDDEEDNTNLDREDDGKSNGRSEVDPKGKKIMRDDKGKGKLIVEEEEDDDSDDDSSDGGSEFDDGDSDLSDDPLAEVDLDNILPSRTRRKQVYPGVYIANDVGTGDDDDDDDDDEDSIA